MRSHQQDSKTEKTHQRKVNAMRQRSLFVLKWREREGGGEKQRREGNKGDKGNRDKGDKGNRDKGEREKKKCLKRGSQKIHFFLFCKYLKT